MADVEWVLNGKVLEDLLRSPSGEAAKVLKRVGTKCVRSVKHNVRVDTGRLRASYAEELRTDGRDLVEIVGTDVDYAIYVELGTRHMRGDHALLNAAKSATP